MDENIIHKEKAFLSELVQKSIEQNEQKDKEIELLKHQLNRLRCFLWMNMPSYSCSKRKMKNIEIWKYFNKKENNFYKKH